MTAQEFYFTIEQSAFAEFKDRGSRFLAYAFPMQTTDEVWRSTGVTVSVRASPT